MNDGAGGKTPQAFSDKAHIWGLCLGVASIVLAIIHMLYNPQTDPVGVLTNVMSGGFSVRQWFSALPILAGAVAVVLAAVARKRIPKGEPGRSMATAGLACGIVGLSLGALQFVACGVCICVQLDSLGL